jgi:phage portal protein BeeE
MIVSGDIDWKQVTKSQDLDFSDSKAGIEREIAQAFGVPPILLGIKDGVHSHYELARMQFWHETLIPMATRIINDLQHWLGGGYMHFSLDLSKVSGLRNVDLLKSVLPTIMNSNTVDSTLKTKITNEVLALLGMSVRTEPTDVSHEGKSDYVANMCARNGK